MIFKKKKQKSEGKISYEVLKEGDAFHLKIRDTDFVAFRVPDAEDVEISGEGGLMTGKIGAKYRRKGRGKWKIIVDEKDLPLMPYNKWAEMASSALAEASGSVVMPDDVTVLGTAPATVAVAAVKCPSCNNVVSSNYTYCPNCGTRIL